MPVIYSGSGASGYEIFEDRYSLEEWLPIKAALRQLLTKRQKDGAVKLLVADGRQERLTTGAHATNDGARWSPNGAYIAVQTSEGGNYDIQVVRVANRERWTVAGTPAYEGQFSWSPTSDRLAFISGRDGFDAVYVTDLKGKPKRITASSSLNPEWSP